MLKEMMDALPADIERFEAMAKADETYEMLRLQGEHVPIVIKINSETRSLEEIARQYRALCNRDSSKPLLIEFSQMYEDMVEFYKIRDKKLRDIFEIASRQE